MRGNKGSFQLEMIRDAGIESMKGVEVDIGGCTPI